jgi:hypothetical protein
VGKLWKFKENLSSNHYLRAERRRRKKQHHEMILTWHLINNIFTTGGIKHLSPVFGDDK